LILFTDPSGGFDSKVNRLRGNTDMNNVESTSEQNAKEKDSKTMILIYAGLIIVQLAVIHLWGESFGSLFS
jgi:hypothetical protein